MAEETPTDQPTMVEKWLEEQQAWQKTMLTYADSMAKDEKFLTHLGNAMRGSLLAGSPYPTMEAPTAAPGMERLDEVLFMLKQLDGRVRDLTMRIEELAPVLTGVLPDSAAQGRR